MDKNLGAFSVSLNVKDINNSKNFYEKLGFKNFAGDISQNWVVMKNGNSVIGLFQGMFEKNIMTFNPGWDQNAKKIDSFIDIRELQNLFKKEGIEINKEIEKSSSGPANFTIKDPDGNMILFDQHV